MISDLIIKREIVYNFVVLFVSRSLIYIYISGS